MTAAGGGAPWWRSAVIYQIYVRSFADADGDGLGDLQGVRARLEHVRDLGADAIWLNPFYPSPQADAGYDVADYRDVDPRFGTLADADAMIAEAHALGLRVIVDLVPNHTSDQHAWFQAALAAPPGSRERARYLFRDGRGAAGDEPPNNWSSNFGGGAWTRVTEADGSPGQWYLHLFAPEQPDLDWTNPEVHEEFESILRFWLDRGVDGFRIDVAHGLAKDPDMPDMEAGFETGGPARPGHPHWDQDEVHEVYRAWRRLTDAYPGERTFVGEVWVATPAQLARYLRPDELHTAFNFGFLLARWDAERDARSDRREHPRAGQGGCAADLGAEQPRRHPPRDPLRRRRRGPATSPGGGPADAGAPRRRLRVPGRGARAARGPGPARRAAPGPDLRPHGWAPRRVATAVGCPSPGRATRHRSGSGRPAPGCPSRPSGRRSPWSSQAGDPASMLSLYREALRIRREHPALGDGTMTWLASSPTVLAFRREPGFVCVVNLGADPAPLPEAAHGLPVILASGPLPDDGTLPGDTAVWFDDRR